MVILPSFGSVSLGTRGLSDRGRRSCVSNRSTYGGGVRFVAVAGCPPFISPPVFPESGFSTTCGGDHTALRIFVVRFRPTPPCSPGRAVPTRRAGPRPSAVPAHRRGGLAYISQQRPAARRRSAGREARGCSRRAEPWPVSGGGAGRGAAVAPLRAPSGPPREVTDQRLPRVSLGGGEPRVSLPPRFKTSF